MEERFLKFSNLACFPELIHGISNRNYGNMKFGQDNSTEVIKNRRQFFQELGIGEDAVIVASQPHSNKVVHVSISEKGRGSIDQNGEISGADGLVTADKQIFLMIKTADCLPVLIYDPSLKIVMAIHAGWRSIIDQIIPEAIYKIQKMGSDPDNLIVGVGPSICQKHFVVKNSVLKLFLENYPSATFVRNNDGYVDLKKAITIDLKKAKIHPSNIEVAHYCTVCDNGIFGSFRKEGTGAPESAAIIGMRQY